jgi:acetyltransferase-like isoleucine patch superfamily enzyme
MAAIFRYEIHPSAKIGFSFVLPDHLEMGAGARIGHLTMCKGISLLKMGEQSRIGNLNWITGFPAANKTFFMDEPHRRPELIVGEHTAITNRHLIDCTGSVRIGRFTTFAGFRSQILTHTIDLYRCRQSSKPITIGDYCFVGTNCVLLGGSALPDYSVLAASSLLNKDHSETHQVYAGTPAKPVKPLPQDTAYFSRATGFVN